jgi:uncharacterized protein (DUF885 family)
MNRLLFIIVLFLVITSCNNSNTASETPKTNSDSAFQQLTAEFMHDYLSWRPLNGVALGFHEYDGKTTDYSKASLDAELKRLKAYDQRLSAFDTASLSPKMYYDFRILQSGIKNEIFGFEERQQFTHNPLTYAGAIDVNLYIKRNFAPLADRLKSVIAIEKEIPALYTVAKANLADSLPLPYIQTAMDIASGSAGFLKGDLIVALKEIKDDSLMAQFKEVNNKAIAATNDYVEWLKKERIPKANNHYAIGKENYQKMLLYGENIDMTPDKMLEIGLAELKHEQESFNRAAAIINPNKKPIDVYHDVQKEHPTAESLIPEARKHLETIRQFLIDKNILTMPSEVRVQVKETPEYARSTGTASMDVPGPFEKKATEAYYYITPVDPKWTAKQKEDWLSMFDYYTTDNVTIHEAYPGHYTQFLHLNASSATQIEKMFGSYAFVEGWAHYTEKMMSDEGYGNTGDSVKAAKYRLAQSGDALLRICRLCVSIKMHCQGMTLDEGTKFFMDNWYQGEKPAHQEALRGTFDPGYLFYTVGKLEILKLREDYKKQEGANYSQKKFHDMVLDNGMPALRLLREVMLKDKSLWNEIL